MTAPPARPPGDRSAGGTLVELLADPASVAVVGASADLSRPAGRPLAYLRRYGYAGQVWVVNPRHDTVAGYPAVPTVAALPAGQVQAAIVSTRAERVPEALRGLDAAGVRVAVVIGSGFESVDSLPRAELLRMLAASGRRVRVVGPNCVGTMSTASGTHLNFSSVLQTTAPRTGSIAMVTQSGAIGNGLLMSLLRRGCGIAHWFSTGDELDVGALELVTGLLHRSDVSAVGLFLEGITDLDWLVPVASAIESTGKPVFAVKVATTDLGQLAAGGHTGRVVGSSDISRAVLEQAGILQVPDITSLADCLIAHGVTADLPVPATVAAVSVSGASAVVVADRVREAPSLRLAGYDETTRARLAIQLDPRLRPDNPLDVPFLGETGVFAGAITQVAAAPGVDIVVAVESSLAHDRRELVDALVARPRDSAPVLLTHLSEDDPVPPELLPALAGARVAIMPTPERAVLALARTTAGRLNRESAGSAPAEGGPPAAVTAQDGGYAGIEEAAALLPADFPWAPWTVISGTTPPENTLDGLTLPIVIKAAGRTITHRSELGAVELVTRRDDLTAAYRRVSAVCAAHGDAVIAQRAVPAGREILVAVLRDPEHGMTALIRPGGLYAELLDQQVVLWGGWSADRRWRQLRGSRLGQFLSSYRGTDGHDLPALHALVETLLPSLTATDLSFAEFNPVIVLPHGVRVVDALIRRGKEPAE